MKQMKILMMQQKTFFPYGYEVFASTSDKLDEMKAAGVPVEGLLETLLAQADVVVDCTPKKIAAKTGLCTKRPE